MWSMTKTTISARSTHHMNKNSNKAVLGTAHKVRRPQTADVRQIAKELNMGILSFIKTAAQGNFAIVPSNFMQIYLYIGHTMPNRFIQEKDHLTVSSIINAHHYISRGALSVDEILRWHSGCRGEYGDKEYLIDYASLHLASLLRIDSPLMNWESIVEIVFGDKRKIIEENIDNKLREFKYSIPKSIWNATTHFIINDQSSPVNKLVTPFMNNRIR